jgi:hypothetical protein
MSSPHLKRAVFEKWGFVALGGLAVVVVALVLFGLFKPTRTDADSRASAEAIHQMDVAQAHDTAARRQAEKGMRSEF